MIEALAFEEPAPRYPLYHGCGLIVAYSVGRQFVAGDATDAIPKVRSDGTPIMPGDPTERCPQCGGSVSMMTVRHNLEDARAIAMKAGWIE